MNAEQKSRIKTLWMRGDKAEAIAAELGVSYKTLRKNCQRLGLPSRYPSAHFIRPTIPVLSERLTAEADALWRNGFDTFKIAALLNVLEAATYNSLSNLRARRPLLSAGVRPRPGHISGSTGCSGRFLSQ